MRIDVHWDDAHALSVVEDSTTEGLRRWGEAIQAGSNRRVPKLTDALERSSRVTVSGREAAISYSDIAAVYQHERLNYHHRTGQAKFLERALVEDGRDEVRALAALLRSRIGD